MLALDKILERWANNSNPPAYIQGAERSEFLLDLVARHAPQAESVIELGCNVGRNLDAFYRAGRKTLTGVDINPKAFALMDEVYSGLAQVLDAHCTSIEDYLIKTDAKPFDLVVTMATLSHIHPVSEGVFAQIVQKLVGDTLIVIEDEEATALDFVFPRPYEELFTGLGLHQVEAINCADVPGLDGKYWARVFKRNKPDEIETMLDTTTEPVGEGTQISGETADGETLPPVATEPLANTDENPTTGESDPTTGEPEKPEDKEPEPPKTGRKRQGKK